MIATFSFTTPSLVCWCTSAISFSSLYSLRIVICLANIRRMSEKKIMLTTSSRLTKIAFFQERFSMAVYENTFLRETLFDWLSCRYNHVVFLYNLKECTKKPTEIFKKKTLFIISSGAGLLLWKTIDELRFGI